MSRPATFALAGWSVLAYFMVSGQVHENHAYLALPLLVVAAAAAPQLRPLYWAITAAFSLNLYMFYGLGMNDPPLINRAWTFIDMSVLLAVAYAVLVVRLTMVLTPGFISGGASSPATRQ